MAKSICMVRVATYSATPKNKSFTVIVAEITIFIQAAPYKR